MGALYQAAHGANEDLVWLGDWSFAWYVDRLMAGPVPLIAFVATAADSDTTALRNGAVAQPGFSPQIPGGGPAFWAQQVCLTEAGRAVVEGRANAVSLNGIDRWIGGVHLHRQRGAAPVEADSAAPSS